MNRGRTVRMEARIEWQPSASARRLIRREEPKRGQNRDEKRQFHPAHEKRMRRNAISLCFRARFLVFIQKMQFKCVCAKF